MILNQLRNYYYNGYKLVIFLIPLFSLDLLVEILL